MTGGASGIGRALADRFADEGAAGVVVADLDEVGALRVAAENGRRHPSAPGRARCSRRGRGAARAVTAAGEVLTPEAVADAVVAALAQERFLILPHPEVAVFARQRADDPDRWLAGMRRLQAQLV